MNLKSHLVRSKDSLYHSVSLNQSTNESTESDSTALSSGNLNVESQYFGDELKLLRIKNINRIILDKIKINSIRTKFDDRVSGNTDILMKSETKLDASFPTNQFLINEYTSPYRLDRNGKSGGTLVYAREDIPFKLVTANLRNAESFFLKMKELGYYLFI